MPEPTSPPALSVVVPLHNERGNLEPLAAELLPALRSVGISFEVILVDDGSSDGSPELLRSLAPRYPELRALCSSPNRGQSAALLAGFDAARGTVLATLDGDLQNDPADLAELLRWYPEYDMVVGFRRRRQDSPARRVGSRLAYLVRNALLRDGIRDTGCSLKVFRASLVRDMPRFRGLHRFLPYLAQLQGATVKQVPVNHRPRVREESNYGLLDRLGPGIEDLVGMIWIRRRRARGGQVQEATTGEVPRDAASTSPAGVHR